MEKWRARCSDMIKSQAQNACFSDLWFLNYKVG